MFLSGKWFCFLVVDDVRSKLLFGLFFFLVVYYNYVEVLREGFEER